MKKIFTVAVIMLFLLSSVTFAAPTAILIVQNKSPYLSNTYRAEHIQLAENLIKESLKNKVVWVSNESAMQKLLATGITDIEVAERGDIIAALKESTEKYILLVSTNESIFGGPMSASINVEIHCRVIDIVSNKYLLNTKERLFDYSSTSSPLNLIKKTMTPIKIGLEKLNFAE